MIERQCLVDRNPEDMSPWGLYFAYHICRFHTPHYRTCPISADIVKSLRDTFVTMDVRWSSAGESLSDFPLAEPTLMQVFILNFSRLSRL
jgi:hypothetical protein